MTTVPHLNLQRIATHLQAIITKATDHANAWDRSSTPGHAIAAREIRALRTEAEAAAAILHDLLHGPTILLPLTQSEAQANLRALAEANDSPRDRTPDEAQIRTWIAQRLLTLVGLDGARST